MTKDKEIMTKEGAASRGAETLRADLIAAIMPEESFMLGQDEMPRAESAQPLNVSTQVVQPDQPIPADQPVQPVIVPQDSGIPDSVGRPAPSVGSSGPLGEDSSFYQNDPNAGDFGPLSPTLADNDVGLKKFFDPLNDFQILNLGAAGVFLPPIERLTGDQIDNSFQLGDVTQIASTPTPIPDPLPTAGDDSFYLTNFVSTADVTNGYRTSNFSSIFGGDASAQSAFLSQNSNYDTYSGWYAFQNTVSYSALLSNDTDGAGGGLSITQFDFGAGSVAVPTGPGSVYLADSNGSLITLTSTDVTFTRIIPDVSNPSHPFDPDPIRLTSSDWTGVGDLFSNNGVSYTVTDINNNTDTGTISFNLPPVAMYDAFYGGNGTTPILSSSHVVGGFPTGTLQTNTVQLTFNILANDISFYDLVNGTNTLQVANPGTYTEVHSYAATHTWSAIVSANGDVQVDYVYNTGSGTGSFPTGQVPAVIPHNFFSGPMDYFILPITITDGSGLTSTTNLTIFQYSGTSLPV